MKLGTKHERKAANNLGAGVPPTPASPSDECSPEALKLLPLESLIDRFGPLDEEVRRLKPTLKTHETYRKEIERRVNDTKPADASLSLAGADFDVSIGPRANERDIPEPAKAFDAIRKFAGSLERFKQLCRFRLTDIDGLRIPADILNKFLTEARTGRRSVEAVRKAESATAKAA